MIKILLPLFPFPSAPVFACSSCARVLCFPCCLLPYSCVSFLSRLPCPSAHPLTLRCPTLLSFGNSGSPLPPSCSPVLVAISLLSECRSNQVEFSMLVSFSFLLPFAGFPDYASNSCAGKKKIIVQFFGRTKKYEK